MFEGQKDMMPAFLYYKLQFILEYGCIFLRKKFDIIKLVWDVVIAKRSPILCMLILSKQCSATSYKILTKF